MSEKFYIIAAKKPNRRNHHLTPEDAIIAARNSLDDSPNKNIDELYVMEAIYKLPREPQPMKVE